MFEFWELESPAYRALSADATRVYIDLRKRLNFDRSNNGFVVYSQRDAQAALHSGWRRAANALAELQHFGFAVLRKPGVQGAYIRPASEWQLTAYECGGQEASKTFMRWDGAPFRMPYQRSEKQAPVVTVKTPRRHGEDAYPRLAHSNDRENG